MVSADDSKAERPPEQLSLNEWTTHTSQGKPYPESLAPYRPSNEAERLLAVDELLAAYQEPRSDIAAILGLLLQVTKVDSVAIPLMTRDGTLVKQSAGIIPQGKVFEAPGICHWLLVQASPEVLVIEDLQQDARTSTKNVVVQEPHMRSYAAAPLITKSEFCIGSLCLWSTKQRSFSNTETAMLVNFAEVIMRILEAHQQQKGPCSFTARGPRAQASPGPVEQLFALLDTRQAQGEVLYGSKGFQQLCGTSADPLKSFWSRFQAEKGTHPGSTDPLTGQHGYVVKGIIVASRRFDCTIVPAGADKLDENAIEVAKPFQDNGSGELKLESKLNGLYFIFLTPLKAPQAERPPFEDLRVGRLLGKGCFGRAYIAKWKGTTVALKVVDEFEGTVMENGIPTEAALMDGIYHPGLVQLLDHKMTKHNGKDRLWLLTEFCNKGSLADAINRGDFRTSPIPSAPICMASIIHTGIQIAEGLAHLHGVNILHCDLSGGNVLLHNPTRSEGSCYAKLADFGLCRIDGCDVPSPLTGTQAYLAPEVMAGDLRSKASDVYAVGVILYEMYCCQKAWAGLNDSQVTFAVLFQGEELELPEDTPPDFASLVMACLNRVQGTRPSAQQVAERLKSMQGSC